MELWLEARPNHLSEISELSELVEQAGLPGIAFNEMKSPPDLAACVALEKTTHTRVVTSLLIAFPRSPTVAAYNAWHLQDISGGRFELGLGTQVKGHIERRFGVQWFPPSRACMSMSTLSEPFGVDGRRVSPSNSTAATTPSTS